jgi:hypothetical protein
MGTIRGNKPMIRTRVVKKRRERKRLQGRKEKKKRTTRVKKEGKGREGEKNQR